MLRLIAHQDTDAALFNIPVYAVQKITKLLVCKQMDEHLDVPFQKSVDRATSTSSVFILTPTLMSANTSSGVDVMEIKTTSREWRIARAHVEFKSLV